MRKMGMAGEFPLSFTSPQSDVIGCSCNLPAYPIGVKRYFEHTAHRECVLALTLPWDFFCCCFLDRSPGIVVKGPIDRERDKVPVYNWPFYVRERRHVSRADKGPLPTTSGRLLAEACDLLHTWWYTQKRNLKHVDNTVDHGAD